MRTIKHEITRKLLGEFSVSSSDLYKSINVALSTGGDYADIYMQNRISEFWALEDNKVKQCCYDVIQGAAVHVTNKEQSGFAYTEDISAANLLKIAKQASLISTGSQNYKCNDFLEIRYNRIYSDKILDIDNLKKMKLLEDLNDFAYKECSNVSKVRANLSIEYDLIYFVNNLGNEVYSARPMVRLDVNIIITNEDKKEQGHAGIGGRYSLSDFLLQSPHKTIVKEAIDVANHALLSNQAPAGNMPVVLGPGWPGVLLHEAVGHGLEADFNRKKSSVYTDMIGKQIANSRCTIIDNALISNCRGSLDVDDEGVKGQETILVEKGILNSFMTDRLSARIMNIHATGNGRRESYAHMPMPRMTNTYMQAGDDDPVDIIRSVEKGIYCTNFSGGQVDITSGKFVFAANVAYLIENGKLTQPVKNLTLIGDGSEVLKEVSMIGFDLSLDNGIGVCGKDSQSVPVGVGQPTLKIDVMTVGGADFT